jgi:hypothetical protein
MRMWTATVPGLNYCLCVSVADLNHFVGHLTVLCSNRLSDEVARVVRFERPPFFSSEIA